MYVLQEEEKKFEPPKRGRTRSMSKKTTDKVDIKAKLGNSFALVNFTVV